MGGTSCKDTPKESAYDTIDTPGAEGVRTKAHTLAQLADFAHETGALDYRVEDGVAVISLGNGSEEKLPWGTPLAEHRFCPSSVQAVFNALDRAEKDSAVEAVVVTAEGKFFSNGFDLHWIKKNADHVDMLQQAVEILCAEILRFPKPTIAAVNGHCTAAGAMLMLAFDVKVMNKDKGFCFVPGIDLGLTYSPGMTSLMTHKLPPTLHSEFITFGERFGAERLAKNGVVRSAVPADEVLSAAIKCAVDLKKKSKHPDTMRNIKESLYCEAIAALECQPNEELLNPHFRPMGFQAVPEGVDKPGAAPAPAEVARRPQRQATALPQTAEGSPSVPAGTQQSAGQHVQESKMRAFLQRRDDLKRAAAALIISS